jgi:DNA invertase Pin-like site-specific DNA recombinase
MGERVRTVRCAVYTRKSHEEGLEQDFNSLDAQREACEAYIHSQKHEGWKLLTSRYDDGGYSGGSMERPALQRLLADIVGGSVDVVVVYKVDRLTRSLTDFAKIVEVLDGHGASFVSVTQAFNTTTSMGRLTLNVLLSFAQFEREVTAERIRDKIAASKRKGLWMGGYVPIGYEAAGRTLTINEVEAATIRTIYQRYLALRSVDALKAELDRTDIRTKMRPGKSGRMKGGTRLSRGHLYRILSNPIYAGRIAHKGQVYDGQHDAIVDPETWTAVQALLRDNGHAHRVKAYAKNPSLLAGLIVDASGEKLVATHCVNQGRRFRYYVSASTIRSRRDPTQPRKTGAVWRRPAAELEPVVVEMLCHHLRDTNWLLDHVTESGDSIEQRDTLLRRAGGLAEQLSGDDRIAARGVMLALVHRITIADAGIAIALRPRFLRNAGVEQLPSEGRDAENGPVLIIQQGVALRRRGRETRLVIEGQESQASAPDPALIKALAQAHRWWDDLLHTRFPTLRALASAYGIGERYAARVLRLAFLPPALIQAILDGTQPPECTLRQLLLNIDQNQLGW